MVSISQLIDTNHEDMIHDAVSDYFGTKLATCSFDRTIKLYSINGSTHSLITELRGHEGPVWQLAWAHPMYGNIIASCSYDRKVIVWKETPNPNVWDKYYEYTGHDSSVMCIDWAPKEFGLQLVCGSSDGAISVITFIDDTWITKKITDAHNVGVNAVCWAPAFSYGLSLFHSKKDEDMLDDNPNKIVRRFVSGGCDNLLKIWTYNEEEDSWKTEEILKAHTDWVRDVAWSPTIGSGKSLIASCSQDRKVIIWRLNKEDGKINWSSKCLHVFDDVVWHVSWSTMGNILAVSGGDNKVTLWKENAAGDWHCISDVDNKAS